MPYQKLPRSRAALAERALTATDRRNPDPSSLNARVAMVGNVGRGTTPELALRAALRAAGARGYRLNRRVEAVRPDLVFGRARVAVFLHGCFWHRCPVCRFPLPRAHREFWAAKFRRNRQRDRAKRRTLERASWRVIEVWEHELREDPARIARAVRHAVTTAAVRRGRASGSARGVAREVTRPRPRLV